MVSKARFIAFYLPQYHPIPENDEWWGKGFTEWTNTAKAKPLYPGHCQPNLPADLGFYDLRVAETRAAQADMARQYGIESFCYYHYWFAGRRLLERPFSEVLRLGQPDFDFCLCWANQTWTGIWHGCPERILIEQTYPGEEDHRNHFNYLLPAFLDKRYTKVDGKPLFIVYCPLDIPNVRQTMELWRDMALMAGLKGLHLVGVHANPLWRPEEYGFDASITPGLPQLRGWVSRRDIYKWVKRKYEIWRGYPTVYQYADVLSMFVNKQAKVNGIKNYPCILPNWDNTPRSAANGLVLQNSTPELFRRQVIEALELTRDVRGDDRILFVKSWNEWAEGNYLEPDMKYGTKYLEVIEEELKRDLAQSETQSAVNN